MAALLALGYATAKDEGLRAAADARVERAHEHLAVGGLVQLHVPQLAVSGRAQPEGASCEFHMRPPERSGGPPRTQLCEAAHKVRGLDPICHLAGG
uniref:Uncharacterized protein n=1 Tax=Streptomyces avermitilis TaxID=33903 RepID=A0A499V9H6_STRAX|nr:hypothetical protein SAVMC3_21390 [Streptomyces avermitilis]